MNVKFTLNGARAVVLTLFAFLAMGLSNANASCVCSAESTITLDPETCSKELTSYDLAGCEDEYIEAVLVKASEHWKGNTNVVLPKDKSIVVTVPGRYRYTITDETGQVLCWNYFVAEDKSGPVCDNYGPNDGDPLEDDFSDDQLHNQMIKVSCTNTQPDTLFKTLEANDFKDCTGIKDVWYEDTKYEGCDLRLTKDMMPAGMMDDMAEDLAELEERRKRRWEPCEIIVRRWYASDWQGNVSPADKNCTQVLVVLRPKKIHFDMAPDPLLCDKTDIAGRNTSDYGAPYFYDFDPKWPANASEPNKKMKKVPLVDGEHFCKWGASFTAIDEVYTCDDADKGCGDNTTTGKLIREWTWFDWCNPNYKETMTQIVEVVDTVKPTVDVQISTWPGNTLGCEEDVRVDITVTEECSTASFEAFVEVRTAAHSGGSFDRYGPFTYTPIRIEDVPVGASVHAYATAWDCCGNEAYDNEWFDEITDTQAPNCVANDDLKVALVKADYHDDDGNNVHAVGARVTALAVNEGSTDNCHPLVYELRWVTSGGTVIKDFASYIDFIYTEEDKAKFSAKCEVVEWVDLKVCEDTNYNGICDDDELYSICATQVTLIDSNEPEWEYVECKSYKCTDHGDAFDAPTLTWDPTGCSSLIPGTPDTTFHHCPVYVECGDIETDDYFAGWVTKTIKRKVTVMKMTEHVTFERSFYQYIYEEVVEDTKIYLPEDIKVVCGQTPTDVPGPVISNLGCSEWLVSEPEISDFTTDGADGDECGTYIYEYELINWCRLNAWEDEFGTIDRNGVQQQLERTGDLNDDGKILAPAESARTDYAAFMNAMGSDVSDANLEDGYARYIQIVKVIDDVDPTLDTDVTVVCDTFGACDLPGDVKVTLTPGDGCTNAAVTSYKLAPFQGAQITDPFGTLSNNMITGKYPTGTHSFHVRVDDECGNFAWFEIPFTVGEECKKPSIICNSAFAPIMPENGLLNIWASELILSVEDNCTDDAVLLDRVHIELLSDVNGDGFVTGEDSQGTPTDVADFETAVEVTCAASGVFAVHTRDLAGNEQFCVVPVAIQQCPGAVIGDVSTIIIEDISNEGGEEIDNVMVKVSGDVMTPAQQLFNTLPLSFSVPMSTDASVTPEKDLGYLNGVNTGDLVALQRDILGIRPLTSAYRIIAADVTGDNNVNTKDMLHISRLVLGIYDEFPNVPSWRFVDKAYSFANPASPWGFPEAVNYTSLDTDTKAAFIGVKMGDLTGNASPFELLGSEATNGTLEIAINDARIPAGATHTIEFTAKDFIQFAGYQFSIQLDSKVAFEGFDVGVLPNHSDANFGLQLLSDGIITTNWANAKSVELEDGAVLFTLTVTAAQDVNVSDIVSITSVATPAEAYDNDLETYGVEALFNRASSTFELFQNTPNPFSNETIIGFNLPNAGKAQLRVMDVSGRVLKQIEGDYNKGFNQISLAKSDLGATGVLYYQLDTDGNSATKKMIILD